MIRPPSTGADRTPSKSGLCGICASCGHRNRPTLALLAVSVLLTVMIAFTAGAQPVPSGDVIRVASWNIGDIAEGSGRNARIMSEHLKILRIDILALNHIDGDGDRRNSQLERIFALANERDGNDWQYRLFANQTISDQSDLVGIAWNADRVSLVDDVVRASVDEGRRWRKPPTAAKFSAGPGLTDIVVMPVQLDPKSPEADCLAGARGEEAGELSRLIRSATASFADHDVIVIGDTECVRDDPAQRQLFSTERVLEFDTGDVAAFASGRTSYNQVMAPLNQPEFARADRYVLLEAESQKVDRPFSDHFILLGPIEVMEDDD